MVKRSIRCTLSFLFATVSIAVGGQIAVGPTVARGADIPEFAKSVSVRVDGSLVPLDEAVRTKTDDPKLKTYREMRSTNAGTPEGQLELARWCRKQKLSEEERLHWWTLLGMQPGHPEAIKRLQLRKFQGLLLTSDEIDQLKKQQAAAEKADKQWMPKLKKIKQAIEHGELTEREAALNELKSINDPLALPAIKKVFGLDDVTIGHQLIKMGANLPGNEGAEFLVNLAINSSDDYTREKAAEALKSRPYSTYVPMLIAGLAAPIELSYDVKVDPGAPVFNHVEWDEFTGRLIPGMYNKIRLHSEYTVQDVAFWQFEMRHGSGYMMTDRILDRVQYNYLLSRDSPDPDKPYEYSGKVVVQEGTVKNQRKIAAKNRNKPSMQEIEKQVKEINEKQQLLNDRIHAALTKSTGAEVVAADQRGTPKPQVWWDWWKKQSAVDHQFARGTEVWTQTGIQPIESILVGDRVLTWNPSSGEHAFHVVVGTQMKSSDEMRTIELDSRTIVTTPAQRFMGSGVGWKAASELKDGVKVDGLAGPRVVQVRESAGKANEMHSLIVADVPTLFVDRMGFLVHDASRH